MAGEETAAGNREAGRSRRDSTVVLIGERVWRHDPVLGFALPAVAIVNAYQWTGLPTTEQYARLVRLLGEEWRVQRASIDATGMGDALARFLSARLGHDRIEPFTFTAQSKSALGYDVRALVGGGRLQLWADDGSPEYRECWRQVRRCQLALHPGNRISFHVPASQGHDDYVMALALLTRTVERRRAACCFGRASAAGIANGGVLRLFTPHPCPMTELLLLQFCTACFPVTPAKAGVQGLWGGRDVARGLVPRMGRRTQVTNLRYRG